MSQSAHALGDLGEVVVADVQVSDHPGLKVGWQAGEPIVGDIDDCKHRGELA